MREGLFGRCDGPDGEFVVEEFRAQMLFGRVFQQVGGVVSAEGRESLGVPDEVHDASDARVFIPLTPGRRSLNVTVSAAIGLSEALRQTDQFPKPMQIS